MIIGYARVSTLDQNTCLQIEALRSNGCEKIFEETASGVSKKNALQEALDFCRSGDILVVWKLDRLSRSLSELIQTINFLSEKNVGFKCLTQPLDTTNPNGMLLFHIFGAMAEFERNLIRERTHAGLLAARSRGRKGGRPKKIKPELNKTAQLLHAGKTPIQEICKTLNIGKSSLYRSLAASKKEQS